MVRAAIGRLWRRRVSAWVLGIALGGPVVHLLQLSAAMAAPPRQAAAASTRQKTKAAPGPRAKARAAAARTAAPSAAPPAPALAPSSAGAAHPSTPPDAAPAGGAKPGAPEAPVTAPASGAAAASDVVRTEEREGEKTYTFGAQEVEGRLKSPQILYFLRRVRAQFDPAPLGHRSFLLELSDTRRHPALE